MNLTANEEYLEAAMEEEKEEKRGKEEEETCVLKFDEPEYISNHKLTMVRSN